MLILSVYNTLLGDPRRFENIAIETTSCCNRACGYCPVSKHRRRAVSLESEYVYGVIDELEAHHYLGAITWGTYNEPLLDCRLLNFIRYADTSLPLCRQTLFTNGDMLTDTSELLSAGISRIVVSDHGSFKEIKGPISRVYVSAPKENTVSSRGGSVNSVTQLMPVCRPRQAIITAEKKLALCCNDYFCGMCVSVNAPKELFAAWKETLELRSRIERGERPGICATCTESCIVQVPYAEYVRNSADEFIRRFDRP